MDLFNLILTRFFDLLLYPFAGVAPVWGVMFVSILTGAIMIWIFGKLTNQQKIRAVKDRIRGCMLEMWVFRDLPRVVLKAQGQALWALMKYAACSLRALLVLIIPVMLIMIQLQARYGYRSLRPGEAALVRIIYAKSVPLHEMTASLESSDVIAVETPALRIADLREVNFRIRAKEAGEHQIAAKADGDPATKMLLVGDEVRALSPLRSQTLTSRLLYPAEPGLPNGPFESIEIEYPPAQISFCGARRHWLWLFLIASIASGIILKKPLGVEI